MFLKLCAACLVLALPAAGTETVSISADGVPKPSRMSVVRRISRTETHVKETHEVLKKAAEAGGGLPVVRKVVEAGGGLIEQKVSTATRGPVVRRAPQEAEQVATPPPTDTNGGLVQDATPPPTDTNGGLVQDATPPPTDTNGGLVQDATALNKMQEDWSKMLEDWSKMQQDWSKMESAPSTVSETGANASQAPECRWRQTGQCQANGPREPWNDKSCQQAIPTGHSGFCDCNGDNTQQANEPGYGCGNTPGTCASDCPTPPACPCGSMDCNFCCQAPGMNSQLHCRSGACGAGQFGSAAEWPSGGLWSGQTGWSKCDGTSIQQARQQAPAVPSGVQYGYSISALINSGWQIWYDQPYSHHTTSANIQPNTGTWILWGSKQTSGASTLSLAAFGRRDVVQGNAGVWENGVFWYTQSPRSNGFSANSSLSLNSADTGNSQSESRLSWHLDQAHGGYRSGSTKSLNSNSQWRKIVMYHTGALAATPAPTTQSPTNSPTNSPTPSPTPWPTTQSPTTSPTNSPTNSPTPWPTTQSPTTSPTNAPTVAHLSLQQVMTCPRGAPASQTLCMSGSQYDQIVGQITTIMQEYKTGSPCRNDNCKLADFAGCVLRAAGHDFMDFRNGAGGSDGCLRFDDPDNKGLVNCLRGDFDLNGDTDPDSFNRTLHDVYRNFCDAVSLADFIVIAGEAVMGFTETSQAVNLQQDFKDRFLYGRTTSATCANAVALPNPANGCAANEVTFLGSDAFRMTWRQTAALMGVHTIGKASLQNSGFMGWWQDKENVARFNNNYYISIVSHGWGPSTFQGKSQWVRKDTFHDDPQRLHPEMMLNTDMCLVYNNVFAESSNCCAWERFGDLRNMNISETFNGQPIYCGFLNNGVATSEAIERNWCCTTQGGDCAPAQTGGPGVSGNSFVPQGPAAADVHAFAANNDLWLGEFESVWKLATEMGAGTLKTLEQSCAQGCQVTVYEHWPEGITRGISGLEAAEQAWGGNFPTGATMILRGAGDHRLGALNNLTSSVKVQGACCKAYGYRTADCSGTRGTPIEATTQLLPGLPAGVVTPATGLAPVWGCNDCAQCVKVEQQCPTTSPTPAPTTDSCDQATDLATRSSPISDSTVTGLNTHGTSCGGNANEKIFFIDLAAGRRLTIGMSTNNYDSRHETRWGGSCPGQNVVQCTDDPDSLPHMWNNNQGSTQRTYFIIDAFTNGVGTFTLTWTLEVAAAPTRRRWR